MNSTKLDFFSGKSVTIEEILTERNNSHGPFSNQASCSQDLKEIFHIYFKDNPRVAQLDFKEEKIILEAIDMILHKIARIAVGNPYVKDHWDDIAGYSALPAKFCEKIK